MYTPYNMPPPSPHLCFFPHIHRSKTAIVFTNKNPIYVPSSLKPFGLEIDRCRIELESSTTKDDDAWRKSEASRLASRPGGEYEYSMDLAKQLEGLTRQRNTQHQHQQSRRESARGGGGSGRKGGRDRNF